MTLTMEDLIEFMYHHVGLSKTKFTHVVESLVEIVKKSLENGEDILISGFGKFYVKEKNERRGRNPHTREALMLDARTVVTFRCSGVLRDKISRKG